MSSHPVTLQRLRTVSCHEKAWQHVHTRPFFPLPLKLASSSQASRHSVPTSLRLFGSLMMASQTISMWLLPLLILLGCSHSACTSRIDTHHHILPPDYAAYCRDAGTSFTVIWPDSFISREVLYIRVHNERVKAMLQASVQAQTCHFQTGVQNCPLPTWTSSASLEPLSPSAAQASHLETCQRPLAWLGRCGQLTLTMHADDGCTGSDQDPMCLKCIFCAARPLCKLPSFGVAWQVNEYAAKLVSQHPERFGFFAFLPMPDLNASIEEARYALDVLKADGVVLLGNARGKYFSQTEFHPLLEELNSRKTVSAFPLRAFIHSFITRFPISRLCAWLIDHSKALPRARTHCRRLFRKQPCCVSGI